MRALFLLAVLSLLAAPARALEDREVARSADGRLVAVWCHPLTGGRALEVRTPRGRVVTRIVHGIDSANWRVFEAASVAVLLDGVTGKPVRVERSRD